MSGELKAKMRNILIPIDGSEHSERALTWYLKELRQGTDHVVFINVIEPVYSSPEFGITMDSPLLPDIKTIMNEYIETGKKLCQNCMDKVKQENLTTQAFLHVDSKPGAAIVKAVEDHGADMIVMGNRGIGMLRRTFLGSVTDFVLHHAHVTVVVVPPKEAKT